MNKPNDDLEKRLNSLPTFTLPSDQRALILQTLQGNFPERKLRSFRPMIVCAALFCIAFLLFVPLRSDLSLTRDGQLALPPDKELERFLLPPRQQEVLGIEGRFAMLGPLKQFVADDSRRGAKMMLFFWGEPAHLLNKPYRLEAVHQNQTITLSEGVLSGPLNDSEDAHVLTKFAPFPEEGRWHAKLYVDEKVFETFDLEVLPPFPKTEHYTLQDSPAELETGKEVDVTIERFGESKKQIKVELLNRKGQMINTQWFKEEGEFIDAGRSDILHTFAGKLTFPERGTWILVIDGEKTKPFKN
ncbi:hypothetical protein [Sporosarcina sp. Te-1]|uniref:hypothetical protein n=1 Tax=Sporosarcina sp. Te-1 TaxID=2818390 RepID=UPI001A9F3F5D|nr:hypothetical protein [Sporosarcina sp. Te-1]QTD42872.1 hypothetical protein J3U78_08970 [Sporosarcina sp. Te-1]